ncbi:MAG TPA: flavodoxin family protein [Smithella sp.]|nr:flavodoxin family protein [Smithella sp.]
MKILALNGSLRGGKGVTFKLLQRIGEGVKKAGGTWDIENLSELKIESCRACNHCQITKTYQCVFDKEDDVQKVFAKMKDADIIIYASPVYVFGISNLLKRLLERIHACAPAEEILFTKSGLFFHATNRSLCGKPFLSLVVCDNVENLTVRNTKEYLRIFGRFTDAPRIGHLERRGAAAWMAALEGKNKAAKELAASILTAYERIGEELASSGRISGEAKKKAEKAFLKIPFPVRVARHISLFRPFIEKEVRRRAHDIKSMSGV